MEARNWIEYEKDLLQKLEHSSNVPGELQDKCLHEILTKNATTEYFKKHGLSSDKDLFWKKAPIIAYDDVKEEIHRVANGESGVLCNERVTDIFTSSGTSGGEHKLFPRVEGVHRVSQYYFDLASALLNRDLPGLNKGKALYFFYVRTPRKTPGGYPAYPALTGHYNSEEFRNRPFDPSNDYTSPIEVILCTDSAQASYCHLLCGLLYSQEVVKLGCFFASTFVRSIRFLESSWNDLVEDLRSGTLSKRVSDPAVREAANRLLKPRPELAKRVEQACCSGNWKGIIRKLWPNAKVIDTVITGAMEQYVSTIDYLSDGLPVASLIYASSESYMGVNLKPLSKPSEICYMLLPQIAYYEFVPVNRSEDETEDEVVKLVDVEQGREYELVITTNAGLYRYRLGDILKVEGFHNKAPLFSFVCRRNVLLSIDSDKTDEKELHTAVMEAVTKLDNVRLTDYTSYADLSSSPPHYVIYWELSSEAVLDEAKGEECCYTMEESFSVVYHRGRVENSIGALELKLVKPGTFDKVVENVAARGGSVAQFKTPRCLKKDSPVLALIESGAYESYYSPKTPSYNPKM